MVLLLLTLLLRDEAALRTAFEKEIKAKDAAKRVEAVKKLAGSKEEKTIEHLVKILKDPALEVRKAAAETLEGSTDGAGKAIKPLGDILSNAAHLDRPAVIEGLNLLDARYMKLDAGNESQFLNMNSPVTEVGIWDVVRHLPKLKDFIVQAMFTHGRRDNTDEKSVVDWINTVKRVKPLSVQIYSVDRFPADKKITKVERGLLEEIAAALTDQTGIPAEVFG